MTSIKRMAEWCHDQAKRLRSELTYSILPHTEKTQTTNFECLSNELVYEIFGYLDSYIIYEAFFYLNSRFRNLIVNSSIPLKIRFGYEMLLETEEYCENVIVHNKHRVRSIHYYSSFTDGSFFTYCNINSSFDHLESIVLSGSSIDKYMKLLVDFQSLPRLYSLTIDIDALDNGDLGDIYRIIIALPTLKYLKCTRWRLLPPHIRDTTDVFLPSTSEEQFSTIEYLVLNHKCNIEGLLPMLRHTPRLRHLTCYRIESNDNIYTVQPVILPNLTYICFYHPNVSLDSLEEFIIKLSAHVEVLIINEVMDISYLNANQWERFIIKHLPHMRKFHMICDSYFELGSNVTSLNESINKFTSLFWIQRQYFIEITIGIDKHHTLYSIHSYKNVWRDVYKYADVCTDFHEITADHSAQGNTENSTVQGLPITQLNIMRNSSDQSLQLLMDKFEYISTFLQYTYLNISCKNIPFEILVKIVDSLPNLDTLKVSSLPPVTPQQLLDYEKEIFNSKSTNNKIIRVSFETMPDIQQIRSILSLCHRIKYFQVNVQDEINLKTLVQFILTEANEYISYLNTLCVGIPQASEQIVHRLQAMIESEKLLTNYILKRIGNNILLKWNMDIDL